MIKIIKYCVLHIVICCSFSCKHKDEVIPGGFTFERSLYVENNKVDSDEVLQIHLENLSDYSYVNFQIEFYEYDENEEPFKLKPKIAFYSTYSTKEPIAIRSKSKGKFYYGKIIVGGTDILPFLYAKVLHRAIFFGYDISEDKTKLVRDNIENKCVSKPNYSVCPKLDLSMKSVTISINNEFNIYNIDFSKSLRQWLMIALSYATIGLPIPLLGFIAFRENVSITYREKSKE